MKRRIVHLTGLAPLILGSVALLLFSCSQDESPLLAGGGGEAPLRITSVGLLSSEVSAIGGSVATRATTTDPLTTGSIGVFRSQGTNYAEELKNKKFSYTSGSWQPATSADTVYLMTNQADVCAYYPYNGAYTDKTAIPLASGRYTGTVDDLTLHDPADICYAINQPMNGVASSTDLTMEHAMAMVQLSFKRLNYDSDLCNLTSITATNANLVGSAKLNITDGTLTAPVKVSPVTWTPGSGTDTPTGIQVPETGSITTSVLWVPCSLSAATTFSFTVDGKKMSTSVSATQLPALLQGKIHRLNFVIHAASITVEEVSIIDWTEAALSSVSGKGRDYIVLPGVPNVKWALSNLVYTAPYGYSFAPKQSDYGSYLNWNVLTDTSDPVTASEWNEANDPCRWVEPQGTWMTPSKEDFKALAALPQKWSTYNGISGRWFGTTDETLAEALSGEYLFLPAAGEQNRDGSMVNEGTHGYYWSRTPVGKNGYSLIFFKSNCIVNNDNTPMGFSVRCIKQ